MSASTSANMRRTTLPLPRAARCVTIAPAARATAAVSSVELLSKTWISAPGRAARKPSITWVMARASLKQGMTAAMRGMADTGAGGGAGGRVGGRSAGGGRRKESVGAAAVLVVQQAIVLVEAGPHAEHFHHLGRHDDGGEALGRQLARRVAGGHQQVVAVAPAPQRVAPDRVGP